MSSKWVIAEYTVIFKAELEIETMDSEGHEGAIRHLNSRIYNSSMLGSEETIRIPGRTLGAPKIFCSGFVEK
jgi:hypothetical protein